jgi:hypothetical protein
LSDKTTVVPPIFNKKINAAGIELLAGLYGLNPLTVAILCDEHLDLSGALLGDVRTMAIVRGKPVVTRPAVERAM